MRFREDEVEAQVVKALVHYRQDELAKAAQDRNYGVCGCLGPVPGEPFCRCQMQIMREQASYIKKYLEEIQA